MEIKIINRKIVFFKTGWAEFFDGRKGDRPTGNHAWLQHRQGHEDRNFLKQGAFYYGYCPHMGKNGPNQIDLVRLGGSAEDAFVDHVDVVFLASGPGGVAVVGWYEDARVYREPFAYKKGRICYARATKMHRVPVDERSFIIKKPPRRPAVWYADGRDKLLKDVRRLLDGSYHSDKTARATVHDAARILAVEHAAYVAVTEKYEQQGYTIAWKQHEHLGWDLEARRGKETVHLEVKGSSGTSIHAELTPQEYSKSTAMSTYRICIVTNALKDPQVHVFSQNAASRWFDEYGNCELFFERRTGARLSAK